MGRLFEDFSLSAKKGRFFEEAFIFQNAKNGRLFENVHFFNAPKGLIFRGAVQSNKTERL